MTFWHLHGPYLNRLSHYSSNFGLHPKTNVESISENGGRLGGKVISTTDWGNLLIWNQGKIELEISKKDGSKCHDGSINHILAEEGELITIGRF